ncbi:Benzoate 4-monooxygenase cytochrome p450 protein [Lasiodiplodia theobromae]|uniref:Benzoate 4-monooxygenase cytochrome p450 protein n=1 Tax=Lasiodiplodia theobromae TaxID=45133 RepID=UPI0015C33F72|nr:Benzoate 4-monooxygenase cytochrome p450 protein [Lasiodiplodia theobromae]KAF4539586.1 Benzoate 4-monooxygenase cytochrome p450 protein [Lasiodiplodia theobromae]
MDSITHNAPPLDLRNLVSRLLSSHTIIFTIVFIIAVNLIHTLWTAVYNVYLHPLRHFPGPKPWIAFPFLTDIARFRGTLDVRIQQLHNRYGETVRISHDTISFISPAAWKDIYGHGHPELPKPHVDVPGERHIMTANAHDHPRLRRAMQPAFSSAALGQQEALIAVYVDLLVSKLREAAATTTGRPAVDMARWYAVTTFDLIGDLAYGESFGGLREGRTNQWLEQITTALRLIPVLSLAAMSPLLSKILMVLGSRKMKSVGAAHKAKARALAMRRIENAEQKDRGDFMTHFMRARGQPQGLSDDELAANADVLIVAGSETTATLLAGVTWFLLSNAEAYGKCVAEVRGAFASEDEIGFKAATARLPYMLACLDEALRLYPPVPSMLQRKTLPGAPTMIAGHMVPENTLVGVHHLSAYHSERNFHRPNEFLPERWLPAARTDPASPFFNDRREVHKPFSFGPRDCIGRNLAYHEMRLILAKLLWNFDMELAEPLSTGWAESQKTYILWDKPPLMVRLKERAL